MKKTLIASLLALAFITRGETVHGEDLQQKHTLKLRQQSVSIDNEEQARTFQQESTHIIRKVESTREHPENQDKRLRECVTRCSPSACRQNNDLAKECANLCVGHRNSIPDWLYRKCSMNAAGIKGTPFSHTAANQTSDYAYDPSYEENAEAIDTEVLSSNSPENTSPLAPAYRGHSQLSDPGAAQRYEITKPQKSTLRAQSPTQTASSKEVIQSQSHYTREELLPPSTQGRIAEGNFESTLAQRNAADS
jgi:hypothetical protein